jgi:hypothetical protein
VIPLPGCLTPNTSEGGEINSAIWYEEDDEIRDARDTGINRLLLTVLGTVNRPDRKGIEKRTKTWDKIVVDRRAELGEWVDVCNKIAGHGAPIFAFANNQYAGNGPARVQQFEALWKAQHPPKPKAKRPENLSLF